MSDQPRQTGEAQDHDGELVTSPPPIGANTRRSSISSIGAQSDPNRTEPAATASIHASITSVVSDGQRNAAQNDSLRNRPRPARLDYGSMRTETRPQQTASPQTPRRPTLPRRLPSAVAPHRGEVFSVDDDPEEVNLDLRLTRTQTRQERDRDRDRASERDREREREREQERVRNLRRRESTLRRRPAAQAPPLRTVESEDSEERIRVTGNDATSTRAAGDNTDPSSEETLQGEEEEETPPPEDEDGSEDEDDDDADLSDAESFTLKDRQEAINETHPFGIRIWKPALYKKSRSVQRNAEGDIHSAPGGRVSNWLFIFNVLWTIVFGWWLAIIAAVGGIICLLLSVTSCPGCLDYGRVLINLSHYLFYPFGKYVKLERDEAYMDEDEGEGRSITEYEQWQTGDIEEGRLFFGPPDINRSLIGRRRDDVEDLEETDSLLGRRRRQSTPAAQEARQRTKKRMFGRGKWDLGRVIFFLSFYFLITPCLFLASGICWLLVFTIPMGKVTLLLFYHLRRHPLALSFHTDKYYSRNQNIDRGENGSSILLCTYRAVGSRYWKYTIDGTNIFLINLLGLVVFVIFDYFILYETVGIVNWITNLGLIFVLALASIIPLAYFIGQAVASISAQSSMGVGATVNAFFATIVEVFLYCVALKEGKAALVEGSIIGSIFAGILFLPGLSMCFGAIRRKTQRFNVKSAGVTSTMLLFAVIGAFGPTLFYQMYGSHEMQCHNCTDLPPTLMNLAEGTKGLDRDCRRCYFSQTPAIHSNFFAQAVQPYIYFATVCLFLSYVVGLLFTLRTHAAVIWNNEPDEKKDAKMNQQAQRIGSVVGTPGLVEEPRSHMQRQPTFTAKDIRDSQMYKRILNQSLRHAGVNATANASMSAAPKKQQDELQREPSIPSTPFMVPPKTPDGDTSIFTSKVLQRIQGLSAEDNRALVQEIAEMAATAAAVAARDATRAPRRASIMATTPATAPPSASKQHYASGSSKDSKDPNAPQKHGSAGIEPTTIDSMDMLTEVPPGQQPSDPNQPQPGAAQPEEPGGHDAPNWSRTKSATILLTATIAYAIIAEILVDTVDSVLENVDIDEKFLGITLFALVPNTTEFLNAIAFAMNGNVALSMEIGSSYALQVMLLQIPALVVFSGIYNEYFVPGHSNMPTDEALSTTFTLIFPQWDMVTVILGVFLMGWVVGEGKSNYFKGSTLIFTYLVIVVGFWFSGWQSMDTMGVSRSDTLALAGSPQMQSQSFRTYGRGRGGYAY